MTEIAQLGKKRITRIGSTQYIGPTETPVSKLAISMPGAKRDGEDRESDSSVLNTIQFTDEICFIFFSFVKIEIINYLTRYIN